MRTVSLSMAIALAGLVVLVELEDSAPPAQPVATADVATIAARVEALRGLRFRSRPVPQRVTPAQARREGLEDLDRSYPEARRRADEQALKLLGLIEPGIDLRLRRGRGGLLRPAVHAAAHRLRDDTRCPG
jgi:hypothetical protein